MSVSRDDEHMGDWESREHRQLMVQQSASGQVEQRLGYMRGDVPHALSLTTC
jgi:hypothetical protein